MQDLAGQRSRQNRLILRKHDVGLTNHFADIFPESETSGKQSLPQFYFNRGILTSYVAHIQVPLFLG
jgi:hypothetical protein